jgi:hypothetical protein
MNSEQQIRNDMGRSSQAKFEVLPRFLAGWTKQHNTKLCPHQDSYWTHLKHEPEAICYSQLAKRVLKFNLIIFYSSKDQV